MLTADPVLTAILIVGNVRQRAEHALASILAQSLIDQMEVLVVDVASEHTPPLRGSDHPSVRVLRLKPEFTPGYVKAEAVRQARGPIAAFLEEHAWAFPGWAEAIVEAFKGDYAGIGAEFHTGNTGLGLADVAPLAHYPLWLPTMIGGETDAMPSHDSCYRRDVLIGYGNQLEMLIFPEVLLHWKLRQDGCKLRMEPKVKIKHYYETELDKICAENFLSGLCFVALSQRVLHQPLWKRITRLVLTPLLPFRRLIQLYQVIRTRRPDHMALFRRSILSIFLIFCAGIAGEIWGTLFGIGKGDVNFLHHQLTAVRQMPAELGANF